uniref:Uncharacterized protein n=1 Tax=Rhizophora mucronata TaxID=61149 RepID=A0A2P2QC37_RHIMU
MPHVHLQSDMLYHDMQSKAS